MVQLTAAMRASLGKLWLRAVPPAELLDLGEEPLESFEVPEAGAVIGRGEDADVTVKEPDEYVSRGHLLLRASGARWTAVDLGSSHGTRLLTAAGHSIDLSPELPAPLAAHDRLILARVASVDVMIEIARRKGRSTRKRVEERRER
ncbi:MAG TPA: FHA domain-containing protein, partial [Thermoanaerobaculia bacterium]|nr:FHA domain-containing protein [Thermoanaerobaculia bacterium]